MSLGACFSSTAPHAPHPTELPTSTTLNIFLLQLWQSPSPETGMPQARRPTAAARRPASPIGGVRENLPCSVAKTPGMMILQGIWKCFPRADQGRLVQASISHALVKSASIGFLRSGIGGAMGRSRSCWSRLLRPTSNLDRSDTEPTASFCFAPRPDPSSELDP